MSADSQAIRQVRRAVVLSMAAPFGLRRRSQLIAKGRFTKSYGSMELDAAPLFQPLMRFLPPEDLRLRATADGIADDLAEDGLIRWYRTDTTDDGLGEPEASFTVCSF